MEKFVLMVGILHVDKIDQDDAGKVPKAKLSGNFCCCLEVDFAVGLFCFFLTGVLATVDINGYKCFCLLDHEKTATLQPYFFAADFIDGAFQTVQLI